MPPSDLPNQPMPKRRLAVIWLSFIAFILALCLAIAVQLDTVNRAKLRPKGPSTQHAMKLMGLVFTMYTEDSTGAHWPGLASNQTVWAPELSHVFPEYLIDPAILVSSEHPGRDGILTTMYYVLDESNPDYETAAGLMGLSFAYLGYAVKDEAGFAALVEARNTGLLDGNRENLSVPGHDAMVFPLREGIERFFITDINGPAATAAMQSFIPVMIEIAGWKHKSSTESFGGTYVLYMDGHVAFVKLGNFPVIPEVMDVLSGLAKGLPAKSSPTESNAATTPHP